MAPKLSSAQSSSWLTVQREGGIYLPDLDLYLDPPGSRKCAFVSHGHSDHFAKHSWTLCSSATLAITKERYGADADGEYETPAWKEPLERGGYLLRLLPAGHTLGSAMLHVTRKSDGASLLYTGDYKLRHGLAAEQAELLPADTLIMETTFGLPRYQFPPFSKVSEDIRAFVRETIEDGGVPVLLGYSLGKAQEAHAILKELDVPVMLHSSVARMTRVYEKIMGAFPPWKNFQQSSAKGHVLIFPPNAARSSTLKKLPGVRMAMLSGWALNPGAKFRYQVDEVFPLSDHADYQELLETVKVVQPSRVLTVHGYVHEFAQVVRQMGVDAWPLSKNLQLELDLDWVEQSDDGVETRYDQGESTGYEAESVFESDDSSYTLLEGAEQATSREGELDDCSIGESSDHLASFAQWVAVCEQIASVPSRLKKQAHMASYFKSLNESELEIAARWFTARLDDPVLQLPPLQVGWASIRSALINLTGISERDYKRISEAENDSGRTSYLVLAQHGAERTVERAVTTQKWTLANVATLLESIRAARGAAAKVEVLSDALGKMTPLMGSYLVRLLTGELRTGSRGGLVEEAIAEAFDANGDQVREANMICGDIGRAAVLAKSNSLSNPSPSPFIPIQVMLASPEPSAEAIWKRLIETPTDRIVDSSSEVGMLDLSATDRIESLSHVWLEDKYDGIRAQAHFFDGRTEFYSRDLKRITEQFHELSVDCREADCREAETASLVVCDAPEERADDKVRGLANANWIVDGEIIAHVDGERLTFHDLQRRLGRKYERELFDGSQIQVQFVVFDLLLRNGVSLLREPLEKRRQLLEELPFPHNWKLINVMRADSEAAIEEAFHAAKRAGNEGLIAKDPRSLYTPGRRGKNWLKLKKALSTLDVVVVKAEQGHGKRSHVLSSYTFAVQDSNGELRVIGKAYTGLTDVEIEELTAHFIETTLEQKGKVRTVSPTVVLEIAFDSIRPSDRHDSGLAMRFPRIVGIRKDKTPDQIDNLAYAESLAGVGVNSNPDSQLSSGRFV